MINNYKYITTFYFKRAFFITNSKKFFRGLKPDAPFNIL
jgi:hypothetical protein